MPFVGQPYHKNNSSSPNSKKTEFGSSDQDASPSAQVWK